MPEVVYKSVAIPLLRNFPGKSDVGKKGNSDTGERIGPITRFIRLFGAGRTEALCADLKCGESRILRGCRKVGDVSAYISGMKLPDGELLIVAGSDDPETASETYAERWQIETMSACLKTEGFRFGDTHLTDICRIDRLLGIVTIAFVWAYLAGDHKKLFI